MIFKFTHGGKTYEFDDERLGFTEARWVKRETGLVGMEFFSAFRRLDPDALLAVFALALRRGGMEINTLDDVPIDDDNGYFELLQSVQETEETEEPKPVRARRNKE